MHSINGYRLLHAVAVLAATCISAIEAYPSTYSNDTAFDWSTFRLGVSDLELIPEPITNNTVILITNETAASAYKMVTDGPSYAEALAFAGGAINLEIIYSADIDGFLPRFKEGMDPSSTWFKSLPEDSSDVEELVYSDEDSDVIRDTDSHHHKKKHRPVIWHGQHSTKRLFYGPHAPGDVIAQMAKKCGTYSCSNSNYRLASYSIGGISCPGVQNRNPGHLIIKPAGSGWAGGERKYFMDAIGVISHVRSKKRKLKTGLACGYQRGECTCANYRNQEVFSGGKYFGINRVRKASKHSLGFIQANIVFKLDGDDTCAEIESAIEAIAGASGPIESIGSNFFGTFVGNQICKNAK